MERLVRIEVHFGGLSLLRRDIGNFRDEYENTRDFIKNKYSSLRTPLGPDDQVLLRIQLMKWLESVYSWIATGLDSLPSSSTLIYAGTFPENLKLRVKIGRDEKDVDRAFTIGRLDDDCIGMRSLPYGMSLTELVEKAKSSDEISRFPIILRSREKIERRDYETVTSRIHVVIYHDRHCFRIFDVSNSETIVEIDGEARRLIGYRARPYILLSLPLGESNKLWIDPIKGATGTPIEITVLRG